MQINKLEKDMILKNYRHLCEVLEIEITGGSAKKAQMRKLSSYAKYRKEGHKIVIEGVYEERQPIKDGRSLGHNRKDFKGFKVSEEDSNKTGVYIEYF